MALLPFIGHVISFVMLMSAAYTIKLIDWLTRFFVNIVKSLTDADIEKDRRTWHPQREISDIVYTGYSLSVIQMALVIHFKGQENLHGMFLEL